MPKTKQLEFNVGDLVYCKKSTHLVIITEKRERNMRLWRDHPNKYIYDCYNLYDGNYDHIYTEINNKNYKLEA